MSNKLSKKQLDLLIERVLSERVDLNITKNYNANPKNVEFASGTDKLTYTAGTEHERDKLPIKGKPALKNIAKSSAQATPNETLNLQDVKQFFIRMKAIKDPPFQHLLNVYRDYINLLKNEQEKKNWNASLELRKDMINKKLKKKNAHREYAFYDNEGKVIIDRSGFENNYAELEFSPFIASQMKAIPNVRKRPPPDMDLFNLEMGNITGEEGRFPADIQNTAKILFSGMNLYQRIKKISEISLKFAKPTQKDSMDVVDIQNDFAELVFLDYLNTMVKNFDERAGAYMFEHFLAMIAGGKVVGARAAIDDDTVTDFEIGVGGSVQKGSSKYYGTNDGVGQALSGFIDNNNKAIVNKSGDPMVFHYIVALKNKKDYAKLGQRIMSLDVHYFLVVATDGVGKKLRVRTFAPDSPGIVLTDKNYNKTTDKKVKFNSIKNYGDNTKVGTIHFVTGKEENYVKTITSNLGKINNSLQQVASLSSKVATSSKDMNRSLREFTMGDKEKGDDSVGQFKATLDSLKNLYDILHAIGFRTKEQEKTESGSQSLSRKLSDSDQLPLPMEENKKKSKKDLDNLIKEVILKRLLK